MAVKIRLTRVGKKRQPSYRVVVSDARGPRDGRYIEQIGRYDPLQEPSIVEIDNERASYWISQGAQPSSQVKKLLEISGALAARPVREGRIHVVGEEEQKRAAESDAAVAAAEMEVSAAEEAAAMEESAEAEGSAVRVADAIDAVGDELADDVGGAPEEKA